MAGDSSAGQAFATGHAVAVAQRLESAARGGEILIGETTKRLVENAALVEPVSPLKLKGKADAVEAWQLIGVLEGAPSFARRLDAAMVGRERELAELRGAFDDAVAEQACRMITVLGPAGIGKSRLANELLSSVRDEASMLVGRCLPYGEGITYWPLRDVVREAAGDLTLAQIEELLEGEEDAEPRRGVRRRSGRRRRGRRSSGRDALGRPAVVRAPVPRSPAGRRLRRPPVGRADLPRSDRVPRGLEPGRADPRRLSRTAGAARQAPDVADGDAERDLDHARGPLRPGGGVAARRPARRAPTSAPTSWPGSPRRRRATRSSSSRCSR